MNKQEQLAALEPNSLKNFLSVRLTNLSRKFMRGGIAFYQDRYEFGPREFRIMLLLNCDHQLTSSELADKANMDKATISRGVSGLRKRGLVTARASKDDLRSSNLVLTKAGKKIANACFADAQARMYSVLEVLDPLEREQLSGLLSKIDRRLDELNLAAENFKPTAKTATAREAALN
ncbi:MarR family winged helix-turn-helix transcriptional regulator [Ruegeria sp. 2012CJ41-6]|uniref:MarR family winged helix-turn-helix transcriptional regulator n=1 Tax=Ruegeria spongiae TaxID=2942209 RepID=A0ABT0Q8U1_9RHOB|nr:MarR family winged helix-turn-helix transcriptional regulator [Ruegeria spongiae]MCL6285598.1 MarR family winged helix-turn-helix transcriptional regulator [Ruegeria spongiae]